VIIPRPVYKPHSVQRRGDISIPIPRLDDHLSRTHVSMRLVQPTQDFDLRRGLEASSFLSLLGLAPGGGYLAACITTGAGGLLHNQRPFSPCRLFTLTVIAKRCSGGMFLWPDPTGCPVPGITRHRALWSADFPRPCNAGPRSPDQPRIIG